MALRLRYLTVCRLCVWLSLLSRSTAAKDIGVVAVPEPGACRSRTRASIFRQCGSGGGDWLGRKPVPLRLWG